MGIWMQLGDLKVRNGRWGECHRGLTQNTMLNHGFSEGPHMISHDLDTVYKHITHRDICVYIHIYIYYYYHYYYYTRRTYALYK